MSTQSIDWLAYAQSDLWTAELLQKFDEFPTAIHAFHCQQATEKGLKAFLVHRNRPFLLRQNLSYLLHLCEEIDESFQQLQSDISGLEPYTTQAIYPADSRIMPTPEEARAFYAQAHKIINFVKSKLL